MNSENNLRYILKAELIKSTAECLRANLHVRGVAVCISGADGSGKTTLARNLLRILDAHKVPAQHLHVYRWYLNLSVTPILMLYNRYLGHKVLIFDRTIFDNLAMISIMKYCPCLLSDILIRLMTKCYPRFDHKFHLFATLSVIRVRRPDTSAQRFSALTGAYERIAKRGRYTTLLSDKRLLERVLRALITSK